MRILLINTRIEKSHFQKAFAEANIADPKNVLLEESYQSAQEFIANALSANDEHIDLIITADRVFRNTYHKHLVDWKNESSMHYSMKNFKVASIPVILFDREIRSSDNYYRHGFDAIIERNEYDNYQPLFDGARSVVKTFRNHIYDDLELLEIDTEALQSGLLFPLQDLYYLRRFRNNAESWSARTLVLSSHFIASPRRLNYSWLSNQLIRVEQAIDEYEQALKTPKFNRTNSEKQIFHTLFNKHKFLLTGDVYKGLVYEPPLMKNQREYEEPDFIRTSGLPLHIPTDVAEIKLPTLELLHNRKRKPNFKQGFNDALIQVGDYERHLRSSKNKSDLSEKIGYAPGKLSFTLLASNKDELVHREKRIRELLRDHHPKIKLTTHHEQLQWLYNFYNRLKSTI